MSTHRLSFTAAELDDAGQVRVLVRSGNTRVIPGKFAGVDLSTGRSRRAGRGPDSEIRARSSNAGRVVTLSSRYRPGDRVAVSIMVLERDGVTGTVTRVKARVVRDMCIISVQGRRVRDAMPADRFNAVAWQERHGLQAWNRNPWCWCLTVRRVKA